MALLFTSDRRPGQFLIGHCSVELSVKSGWDLDRGNCMSHPRGCSRPFFLQMAGLSRTTWTSGNIGTSRTACRPHTGCWTGVPSALWWWTQCRTRAASSTQLYLRGSMSYRRAGSATRWWPGTRGLGKGMELVSRGQKRMSAQGELYSITSHHVTWASPFTSKPSGFLFCKMRLVSTRCRVKRAHAHASIGLGPQPPGCLGIQSLA